MATIKKDKLPKGISWREERKCYLGRVTHDGKTECLYDKDWKRLNIRLQELRVELDKGTYIKGSNVTLNKWFDEWMEQYKKRTIRISTYSCYVGHFDYYVRDTIGKKKLKDVTTDDIQKLYNDLRDRDFSLGTIKLVNVVLGSCFNKAVQKQMIATNPVMMAELPKCKEKKEKYVFSQEEQVKFMEYVENSYLKDFFRCVLMTGMRNGEARALRWGDVEFIKKKIYIVHTLIGDTVKERELGPVKTKTSKREVPMVSKVYEELRNLKIKADEAGIGSLENFVFCLPNGEPISRFRVEDELARIEKKMKEDGVLTGHITCHTLRHAFATRAVETGVQPQVLKTILGHKNLSVTMDLYAHVLGDTKEKEMKLMEKVF